MIGCTDVPRVGVDKDVSVRASGAGCSGKPGLEGTDTSAARTQVSKSTGTSVIADWSAGRVVPTRPRRGHARVESARARVIAQVWRAVTKTCRTCVCQRAGIAVVTGQAIKRGIDAIARCAITRIRRANRPVVT